MTRSGRISERRLLDDAARSVRSAVLDLEVVAIGSGSDADQAAEVEAERGGAAQAAVLGDALDRNISGLEAALRRQDALVDQPLAGSGAGGGAEMAGQGAEREPGLRRQLADRQALVEGARRPGG